jgi:membrane protease YdiL (CAAX protease family)
VRSLVLLALVAALLLLTALASPGVAWVVSGLVEREFRFSRIYNRVFEVLLVLTLLLGWRRLDLGTARDIGFRQRGWPRRLGAGLAIGFAGIGAGLALCALLGAVTPGLRYPPAKAAYKTVLGIGSAVAVGVGEEALFRGVLLRRFGRDFGVPLGVGITTVVYSAVHAIGRGGTRAPVHAGSGFERTAELLAPLVNVSALPELLGLALFGLLLAVVRLRSGGLWTAIGIHAAWVAVFRIGRLFVVVGPTPAWLVGGGWPPLVGGAAGWLAVGVTALLFLRLGRRREPGTT